MQRGISDESRNFAVVKTNRFKERGIVRTYKTLIRFETPAPPARNTNEAQEFVAEFLRKRNFSINKWDVYPNDPNVVGVKKE